MDSLYGGTLQELPSLDDIDYMGSERPLTARSYTTGPRSAATTPFTFSARILTESLMRIYKGEENPSEDIDPQLFEEVYRILHQAQQQGLSLSQERAGRKFTARMDQETARFSAFKVHRMQGDVARQMFDESGALKTFEQWKKDTGPMLSHHVNHWLRTEYDTAVIRAHQAADWQRFQRHADVLPNLEWMPSTSAHPGSDHRQFWGTILPVDHPFWDRHRPGDRWNCKCSLDATDSPCTAIPDGDNSPQNLPAPGLDCNPGTTASLFAPSHPYIANAYPGASDAVERFMQQRNEQQKKQAQETTERIRARRKELQKEADSLKGSILRNKMLSGDIQVTKKGIKEWLNQPHKHYEEKNEMLARIGEILRKAKYKGWAPDIHDINAKAHIFETEVSGDKSWIIVRELSDGKMVLHSITDSDKILSKIKK